MPEDVKVWPIENKLLCFHVESRSDPRYPREVDLEAYKFNGECNCQRFDFKCNPLLARGANPAEHLRCTHIRAARSYFLSEILPKIVPIIKPLYERKTTMAQQAEGFITAIIMARPDTYPPPQKLEDLMALKAHVDAAVEQIQDELNK